ncbi:NAD(P)H-binding protein [Lactobacillus gigeriorum]|uniref:Nucleoside-diphosphate-sugar epimerase n=1 Tax=Lactobacillus gigeriorum DSM 23908 = CRBIP 24.85 TaxID=1423751 RepID=I7LCW1_9LACO|nr:NAD(P)H-binding protein [Lactobacillus gigeriorum]KRN14002.1 Nucleoside-diphosphate-sugar epimerase [Lactobacillus gigeriorum DSM 23908 = CRBIP 24.85]CCI86836.1 Nucleoside-diphosphate-sugar epimerase [Lactobacillus gigeriorum DSM 23908 = CRBIP 24.85]
MIYAISAATGHFGQAAVNYLRQIVDAKDIVIIARNEAKAQKLFPDLTVRVGSYDDAASMKSALAGVDRLLFISSQPGGEVARDQQHRNVVEAIKASKVSFVAYTSFPDAQNSVSDLAVDHALTERLLQTSGVKHAFLRNNWYLENEISFVTASGDVPAIYWASGKAGWALEREYAEAAVKVLTGNYDQEVFEFAGVSRSYAELGDALVAVDATAKVKKLSHDDYVKALENSGLDHNLATLYASFQLPIDNGSLEEDSIDLPRVLGHELTPLGDAIREIRVNSQK